MKKTLKKVAVLMTSALLLIATSCSKDAPLNDAFMVKGDNGGGTSSGSIEQTSPFDYIGEYHNDVMDRIGSAFSATFDDYMSRESITEQDWDSLAAMIYNAYSDIVSAYDSNYTSSAITNIISQSLTSIDEDGNLIDPSNSMLYDTIQYLVSKYVDIQNINEFIDSVRHLELSMIHQGMTTLDTQIVMCLNVYSHSMAYWDDAANNSNNPWYDIFNSNLTLTDDGQGTGTDMHNLKKIINSAKNWVKGVFHAKPIVQKVKKAAAYDAVGALIGVIPPISTSTGFTSVPVTAAIYSAIGFIAG